MNIANRAADHFLGSEIPKEVIYPVSRAEVSGVVADIRGPIATKELMKLNVKLSSFEPSFLVLEGLKVSLDTGAGPIPSGTNKRRVIRPGLAGGFTMVWPGDYRVPKLVFQLDGIQRIAVDGEVLAVPDMMMEVGERLSMESARCEVISSKSKKKSISAVLSCASRVPVLVDPREVLVHSGANRVPNQASNELTLLLPGEQLRFKVDAPQMGGTPQMTFGTTFRLPLTETLAFEPVVLATRW